MHGSILRVMGGETEERDGVVFIKFDYLKKNVVNVGYPKVLVIISY